MKKMYFDMKLKCLEILYFNIDVFIFKIMEKMKPMEEKMKYQINKLLSYVTENIGMKITL